MYGLSRSINRTYLEIYSTDKEPLAPYHQRPDESPGTRRPGDLNTEDATAGAIDNPERSVYEVEDLSLLVITNVFIDILWSSIFVLTFSSTSSEKLIRFLQPTADLISWIPVGNFIFWWICALCLLQLEDPHTRHKSLTLKVLVTCFFLGLKFCVIFVYSIPSCIMLGFGPLYAFL